MRRATSRSSGKKFIFEELVGDGLQGLAAAAQFPIDRTRDSVTLAFLPQLQEGELQKRQRGWLAQNVFKQGSDNALLKLKPDLVGRFFNRAAQFCRAQGQHALHGLLKLRLEFGEGRDPVIKVRAHGEDDAVRNGRVVQ